MSSPKKPVKKTAKVVAKDGAADPRMYFNAVTVEVVFTTDPTGPVSLRKQFFECAPSAEIPAHRMVMIQNTGVHKVLESLPADQAASFKPLDVFVTSIVPLGRMTNQQFWRGMDFNSAQAAAQTEADQAQAASEAQRIADAAGETPRTDNVTPIRPAAEADTNEG